MDIVELSHQIYDGLAGYPSDPLIHLARFKILEKDQSMLHKISFGTHTGTHLDAPAHIIKSGKTLDQIKLTSFYGGAIKLDKESITNFPPDTFRYNGILFETGWGKNFSNPDLYYSTERPHLPEELLNIVTETDCRFFGCDLPSVDVSGTKEKTVHELLLSRDIIIYENLANLDKLPLLVKFTFIGFPLNLRDMDGSPVRAVAIVGAES